MQMIGHVLTVWACMIVIRYIECVNERLTFKSKMYTLIFYIKKNHESFFYRLFYDIIFCKYSKKIWIGKILILWDIMHMF